MSERHSANLLRKTNLAEQEETENEGGTGYHGVWKDSEAKGPDKEMKEVPNVAVPMDWTKSLR